MCACLYFGVCARVLVFVGACVVLFPCVCVCACVFMFARASRDCVSHLCVIDSVCVLVCFALHVFVCVSVCSCVRTRVHFCLLRLCV